MASDQGPLSLVIMLKFPHTHNKLTSEVGGYQHVVVLEHPKVVAGDIVEALQKLPPGTTHGDCIQKFLGFMLCYILLVN